MTQDLGTAIRTAEQARCAAMLANDGPALEALIDDRLQFHHASGAVDDKSAYIAKIAAGRIRYSAISWSEERVVALAPQVAMLTGKMVTQVRVEGTEKRLVNRVITVWCADDGAWRLVAFQSTPITN